MQHPQRSYALRDDPRWSITTVYVYAYESEKILHLDARIDLVFLYTL